MSLAIVNSRASFGVHAVPVTVEVHMSNGLPALSIVGLPETAVKESKDRVRSALINSNFVFPNRRITVNLAPADLPKKDGGRFDLPIAIGILVASQQILVPDLKNYELAGELALCGKLRPITGILPFALATKNTKKMLIVPKMNVEEAALVKDVDIFPAEHLLEVCAHLNGSSEIFPYQANNEYCNDQNEFDLTDVCGQYQAKRALEITAAGQHGLLMIGPPGTGKTMLANRLLGILPQMRDAEALETAAVYSIYGKHLDYKLWLRRPFRAPHHTASSAALVGGGNPPKPGEISLAHNGVLFLDELPEFNRHVLEVLREPLESGMVIISRASYQFEFPAKFQLIAAMNPCPCGYLGDKTRCQCTQKQVQQYLSKISGPLLDRIDLHVLVPALPKGVFSRSETNLETSSQVRGRVEAALRRQTERQNKTNSMLNTREVREFCKISDDDHKLIDDVIEKLGLSARAYHRILKIARTIADLSDSVDIKTEHLVEAINYRRAATTMV